MADVKEKTKEVDKFEEPKKPEAIGLATTKTQDEIQKKGNYIIHSKPAQSAPSAFHIDGIECINPDNHPRGIDRTTLVTKSGQSHTFNCTFDYLMGIITK